jgi:hypothetical protein
MAKLKITVEVEYEKGDIFNMPKDKQIALIAATLWESQIITAKKTQLFPFEYLLFKTDAAIMLNQSVLNWLD